MPFSDLVSEATHHFPLFLFVRRDSLYSKGAYIKSSLYSKREASPFERNVR